MSGTLRAYNSDAGLQRFACRASTVISSCITSSLCRRFTTGFAAHALRMRRRKDHSPHRPWYVRLHSEPITSARHARRTEIALAVVGNLPASSPLFIQRLVADV